MTTATLTVARATTILEQAAELAVLERFDDVRRLKGHDYGVGQRHSELMHRRRDLEDVCRIAGQRAYPLPELTGDHLRAALKRVGHPRIERILREDYRRSTPATRRTLEAWRDLNNELALRA